MVEPPNPQQAPTRSGGRQHFGILIGLIVGAAGGVIMRAVYPPAEDGASQPIVAFLVDYVADPLGQIFLRLLFMLVIPLVLSALILGVVGIGDVRRLGRVGLRSLLFTVILSSASVAIGVGLTNAIRPGAHLPAEQRAILAKRYAADAAKVAPQPKTTKDALLDIIPRNPLREIVGAVDGSSPGGGMLAVMFFSLAFGMGLLLTPQFAGPVVAVLEGVFQASMLLIRLTMYLAPVGVAGLMFKLTAVLGPELLLTLMWFVLTALAALSLHFFGVYGLVLALFARMNPLHFLRETGEIIVTAFTTSSSNATLPTALRVSQERLGLRREISNFVLTVGATANQNGTALYEGVTILFLCQVFGVDLTLGQQIGVVFTCILAGVGTAGVPSGAIPFIALVLGTLGVPPEAIGVILGVDRLLDMCRTVVNVIGDVTIATCVDRWEGEMPPPRPN